MLSVEKKLDYGRHKLSGQFGQHNQLILHEAVLRNPSGFSIATDDGKELLLLSSERHLLPLLQHLIAHNRLAFRGYEPEISLTSSGSADCFRLCWSVLVRVGSVPVRNA
jgi:hypothetical protein